ncbi:hypothetical protein VPHK406_0197 [Vibrio phage K406]
MGNQNIDKQIKIRVDEWMTKIETTSEGTYIYIEEEDKEGVLEVLMEELGGVTC